MRRLVGLLLSVSLVVILGAYFIPYPSYAFAPNAPVHSEAEIDRHRLLYVDLTGPNPIHIHLKMSNGWRLDPWHVLAHVMLFKGHNKIFQMDVHVWCPASLGGHAHECNYDFNGLPPNGDVWYAADGVSVTGNTEAPHGKPPPTVPFFIYHFP